MLLPDDLIIKKNCSKAMISVHKKYKSSVMASMNVNKKTVSRWGIYNVKKKIVKAYIIGKNISFFRKQIRKSIPFSVSKNMRNAVNSIYKDLKSSKNLKKTILLSPAAASFDQFNNFENRGNYFKNLIIKKFKQRLNV